MYRRSRIFYPHALVILYVVDGGIAHHEAQAGLGQSIAIIEPMP